MKTFTRRIGWLIVSVMGVALAVVSLRAADGRPWTGEKALGDVAVSFDGTVQFYGNDGLALGTLTFAKTRRVAWHSTIRSACSWRTRTRTRTLPRTEIIW